MTATRRELGIRRGSGSSEDQGGLDVETGRFRCDDGDPGCHATTAAETKGTQRVDGQLPTPRPARWQIRQKHMRVPDTRRVSLIIQIGATSNVLAC